MNISLAQKLLTEIYSAGVREICLCAGARNSPFVFLLEQTENFRLYHFFDERSAAFFALGRICATNAPMAVITTSGTAAAELLPAAVEAHYSGRPLLLITADRPRTYRQTGAPQSIEQVGLFSHYIEGSSDLESTEEVFDLGLWSKKSPYHVNVSFDEPLMDEAIPRIDFEHRKRAFPSPSLLSSTQKRKMSAPLVIVGPMDIAYKQEVVPFLNRLQAPIYAEAASNLRGEKSLSSLMLQAGEASVHSAFAKGHVKSVLRLGGVPTLRFWRDLETSYKHIPVKSVSQTEFSGLSRRVDHLVGYHHLNLFDPSDSASSQIFQDDLFLREKQISLFRQFPESESALLHELSKKLAKASIYLGNSLPIREWDLAAPVDLAFSRVCASRGANGIDGQVSTFLGGCDPHTQNVAVLGDLTALYDLNALWITDQVIADDKVVIIINNSGGQIFNKMFGKDIFLNRHNVNFSSWARMWNWSYDRWEKRIGEIPTGPKNHIIELIPDGSQSDLFWDMWKKL